MFIFHCIHTITKPCLKLTCLEEGFACGSKFFSALKIFNPIFFYFVVIKNTQLYDNISVVYSCGSPYPRNLVKL